MDEGFTLRVCCVINLLLRDIRDPRAASANVIYRYAAVTTPEVAGELAT
jgi:hypothetical protein